MRPDAGSDKQCREGDQRTGSENRNSTRENHRRDSDDLHRDSENRCIVTTNVLTIPANSAPVAPIQVRSQYGRTHTTAMTGSGSNEINRMNADSSSSFGTVSPSISSDQESESIHQHLHDSGYITAQDTDREYNILIRYS